MDLLRHSDSSWIILRPQPRTWRPQWVCMFIDCIALTLLVGAKGRIGHRNAEMGPQWASASGGKMHY